MQPAEAIESLKRHARYAEGRSIIDDARLVVQGSDREREPEDARLKDVDHGLAEILTAIESLNHHYNGAVPSKETKEAEILDRNVVFHVNTILDELLEIALIDTAVSGYGHDDPRFAILVVGRTISLAWIYLLHGDFDNIIDEMRLNASLGLTIRIPN